VGPVAAPTDVVINQTDSAGTVRMDWKRVRGANSYVIERAADGPQLTWIQALATTKSKAIVNTMTSGTKYWFRVAGIGAAGQGPWSDAIAKFAP
jgi:hypothetical protein